MTNRTTEQVNEVERKLHEGGVFKGAHGLEGLANSDEFWDKQGDYVLEKRNAVSAYSR